MKNWQWNHDATVPVSENRFRRASQFPNRGRSTCRGSELTKNKSSDMKRNNYPALASIIFLVTAIRFLALTGRCAEGETWIRKADMPTPRIGLTTCVVAGRIYAIGGYREAGASGISAVEAYDPTTDSWSKKTGMPTARLMLASAVVDGKIYAIGGDQSFVSSPMKTVEQYDPVTDTWMSKAEMPTARSGLAAAAVDGKIYVIGGLTTFGASPLSTVEVYDPATDTWARKADMPSRRGLMQVSVVHGKIYAIGSSSPPSGPWLPTIESYDPMTDTWSRKASMPTARGAAAGGAAHGRIYVLGGRNAESSLATVEEYDPLSNSWMKRGSMRATNPTSPSKRWNFSASEVNGRIYVIGGAFEVAAPHLGLALVVEYTPPIVPPALQMEVVQRAGQRVLQLGWLSHPDYTDLLQSGSQLPPNNWSEVERLNGTGETRIKEIPTAEAASFYRLQRLLR